MEASTPEATCSYLRQIAAIDGNAGPVADLAAAQCPAS
jgi:hypothetical protein